VFLQAAKIYEETGESASNDFNLSCGLCLLAVQVTLTLVENC